jgi:hypothetical protein
LKSKCSECEHLNKEIAQRYGKAFRYGCNLRKDGYISTWINTERLLSEVSCNIECNEDDEEMEVEIIEKYGKQLSIFVL